MDINASRSNLDVVTLFEYIYIIYIYMIRYKICTSSFGAFFVKVGV